MSNTALMKQKLARLQARKKALEVEAAGLARDIIPLINPALTPIEEMNIAKAASKMDDLVVKQGELLSHQTDIWSLEEELGY